MLAEVNPEGATSPFSVASKDKELSSSSDGDDDRESVDEVVDESEELLISGIETWYFLIKLCTLAA